VSLRLYDTRTRTVRPLEPVRAGQIGVYVCGPTVQAAPHVGHLRSAVAMDVLHRWLLARGEQVTFVRNVTDVDDKILHDAAHNDEPWWALSARMTRAFDDAYDAVQVLRPTIDPRVTGHLPQIVVLIQQIVDRGHAYESGGDVYLAVRSAPAYGVLSNQSLDALQSSEKSVPHGHTGSKRDPLDFALWKAAKEGEPSWPSPWGMGRPGWHIECSAMAVEYLGEEFDIHGGGLDLVFPHHENEVAQSTCAGHPFARLWLHHGLVNAGGGEKMSKSLGNSLVVPIVLERVRAIELRFYIVAAHYRSHVEFSYDALEEAAAGFGRIEGFLSRAVALVGSVDVGSWPTGFVEAMNDDLGTSTAVGVLYDAVREGNKAITEGAEDEVRMLASSVRAMLAVLGIDPFDPHWAARASSSDERLSAAVSALVSGLLEQRAQARAQKDFAAADTIRDRLKSAGIELEDTPQGPKWSLG
jgi:cysteinyl-tRNA synthetase